MAAAKGNKYRALPDEERASVNLNIRVRRLDRDLWAKQANLEGLTLSAWVLRMLNKV